MTPAGRSSSRRDTPSSQCGLGTKSSTGGLTPGTHEPVGRRVAIGHPLVGKVGDGERQLVQRGLDLPQPGSNTLTSSPDAFSRSIRSSAGCLARFRRATSSLAELRSAFSASTRTSNSRRWRSSSSMASIVAASDGSPRRIRLARLPAGSCRSRLRSITLTGLGGRVRGS